MLPPEIFSEIFGCLTSEASVLFICSQAHPIFAQLIEPSLYAHVIVHDDGADHEDGQHLKLKPYQLSELLSDNPRILNYLRSLRVEISYWYNKSDGEVMNEMIVLLPRLKLERIQLIIACGDIADWQRFPKAFRTAFVACISTSFMKEICLDEIFNVPISSFVDCPGLKRLTLCQRADPPLPLNASFNFPHLEALELSDWLMDSRSQSFFSQVLTHGCLRSLTLRTYFKEVLCTLLPHLLVSCSTSLVNLDIYYAQPSKSIY